MRPTPAGINTHTRALTHAFASPHHYCAEISISPFRRQRANLLDVVAWWSWCTEKQAPGPCLCVCVCVCVRVFVTAYVRRTGVIERPQQKWQQAPAPVVRLKYASLYIRFSAYENSRKSHARTRRHVNNICGVAFGGTRLLRSTARR